MNFAFVDAFPGHGLHHLLATATQLGQVKLALLVTEFAIAALFDAFRQVLRDIFLHAPQQQRPQFRREPSSRDALGRFGILATRLVSFRELFLIAEITGLDEISDAPEVQQSIFQGCARQRQPVLGLELLHRLRDLCSGIFDELRFVQYERAESELLQLFEVTPQQGIIGHNEIVLRDLLAQIVPRCAAFEHEHLLVRRKTARLALPIVQNRSRTDYE